MPAPPPIYYKTNTEYFALPGPTQITDIDQMVAKNVQSLIAIRFYLDSEITYPSTTIIQSDLIQRYSSSDEDPPDDNIEENTICYVQIDGDTLSLETSLRESEIKSTTYTSLQYTTYTLNLGTFGDGLNDGWNSLVFALRSALTVGPAGNLAIIGEASIKGSLNGVLFTETYSPPTVSSNLAATQTFLYGISRSLTSISPAYDAGGSVAIPFTDFLNVSTMEDMSIANETGAVQWYDEIEHNFGWSGQNDYWNIVDKDKDILLYPKDSGGKVVIIGGGVYTEDNTMVLSGPEGSPGPEGPEGPEGPVGYSYMDGGTWDTIYVPDQVIDGGSL